ncbi:MAG: CHAD domain-containing protein [Magnetococcales bacterium]|nr:CHAD domain-containing protein [Magnetococcales bacterium]
MAKVPTMKKNAPITAKMSTEKAFQTILQHNFKYMEGWAAVAYEGKNIRGVHQARVAFRRMRSSLGIFRRAFPRTVTDHYRVEMKWAASAMGQARDTDVFISETLANAPKGAGKAELTALVEAHHKDAYKQVRAMFDSGRYKKFKSDFKAWSGGKWGKVDPKAKKKMAMNVADYAKMELGRRYNKLEALGKGHAKMSDDELHRLRIECKKMRYACEFFVPVLGKAAMRKFIANLKAVQGLLGSMQDASVMPVLLGEITAGNKNAKVKKYCDSLVGSSAKGTKADVRKKLPGVWKTFTGTKRPW